MLFRSGVLINTNNKDCTYTKTNTAVNGWVTVFSVSLRISPSGIENLKTLEILNVKTEEFNFDHKFDHTPSRKIERQDGSALWARRQFLRSFAISLQAGRSTPVAQRPSRQYTAAEFKPQTFNTCTCMPQAGAPTSDQL